MLVLLALPTTLSWKSLAILDNREIGRAGGRAGKGVSLVTVNANPNDMENEVEGDWEKVRERIQWLPL